LILLDTCVLIFDALTPERLSPAAVSALDRGEAEGTLVCADISLWEIAMLIAKGRLNPGTSTREFCRLVLDARGIRVLPITSEIATLSAELDLPQGDPADRLVAATCLDHGAVLVTVDRKLRAFEALKTLW
jgi:PIN domain nuclease of toxin-antitoxin system